MGKASRAKRERQENGSDTPDLAKAAAAAAGGDAKRQLPVFWIVIGVLALAGIVALIMTSDSSSDKKGNASAPDFAAITVAGDSLDRYSDTNDTAVGETVPKITGTTLENEKLSIDPADGSPKVIFGLAHWCPHCQREVPKVVEWAEGGGKPDNVNIYGISTSADEGRGNWPPQDWLARENWTYPTLVDDEAGSAVDALGLTGFPLIVFVNADGTVSERFSGEMPIDDFDKAVKKIAKTKAAGDAMEKSDK